MAGKKAQQKSGISGALAKGALVKRPPVVAILGHIDHGKTTLLDYIRKTNIVDSEAGGITQRISAYEIERVVTADDGATRTERITFIDTPGHEAFSGMRERGATTADVAILVVSAEDGVKPQTIDAYREIEKAKVPFVVAINKIDKPSANVDRAKMSLAEAGIYVEGFGGNVSFVPISAKTGQGVEELLDLIVLTAEIAELKGDPSALGSGTIIETHRDPKKGISATIIVKNGRVGPGMFVAAGSAFSPTRILENHAGKKVAEATFSQPIRVVGWNKAPRVGESFVTFDDKKTLEAYIEEAEEDEKKPRPAERAPEPAAGEGAMEKKLIPLVIKADVQGSVEAIEHEIAKISHERIALKTLLAGIGDITESDIKAAGADKDALVIGFNVRVDSQAAAMIERLGIAHETFDIIYNLREWLEEHLTERTPKIQVEEIAGRAKILKFFSRTKDRQIVGGKVTDREISLGHQVKIIRRETLIGDGLIRELQQTKVKTSSVQEGFEFGAMIEASIELAPGDVIEDFIVVEK
ncbi:MAG: translation initiation factor IF-2 [Patescibacteria group bacterium]|nr:translation initiation factor IF-2 [Patescibacteria group bacterium]MDE2116424.1 translation initiation factor IF-2 [Patescibacteria group bacterium]